VYEHAKGMKFIVVPPSALNPMFDFDKSFTIQIEEYYEAFGSDTLYGAIRSYQGTTSKNFFAYRIIAKRFNIPLIAQMMYIIMIRKDASYRMY
jgi:error-prone DNA polymerase